MIDFEDDLDEIFSTDDHGSIVVFNGNSFDGILNQEFISQDGGGVGIESSNPVLYTKTVNVPGVEHGSTLTVDSNSYEVVGIQPDGVEMTALVLDNA